MKTKIIIALVFGTGLSSWASLFSSGTLNAVIPDNNANGYANTISVSGVGSQLTDVTVQLNLSGGYNGDLLAYLTYDNQTVTLFNRVGQGTGSGSTFTSGYANPGFNGAFSDAGTAGFHAYQANGGATSGQVTGTWQPDSGGLTFASAFGGVDPNGTWALFFSDLSAGGQSTLVSWSLDITAVPEPVNVALGTFAGLLGIVVLGRKAASKLNLPKAIK